jgi:outer membrane protein TolC
MALIRHNSIGIITLLIFLFQALVPLHFLSAQELFTWEECIKEAAKNHPDLISASEAIKESEAAKKITSSGEYPQVSASLSASTSKAGNNRSVDSYSTSLSASQLLFDGKKTINNVKAAQENIQAAKHNFRFTSSEVRQALRVAFVNLLKAQEMTRIAQEIFEIRRANLELITLRYQSGLEHRGALLTAEANLAQAQYNINTAVQDLRVAQMNLSKQLGRGKWSALSVSADFTVQDIPSPDMDLETLAKNNPQVLKFTAQKNAAEFNLRSAYGGFAPSVSVSANAGKSGTTFFPQNREEGIGVSLNLPLFEGGLKTAQVAQAEAALNQLKENERSIRDSVITTLEQYRAALLEAIDNVNVQNKSLLATEERSKIAEAQYSIGTISFDSWTIIEDNLVSAKRSYLNAQADALLAEANWIMAKGETLEYKQ